MTDEMKVEGLVDASLQSALDRYKAAIGSLYRGQSAPYADCWDGRGDVTLYGAWGPVDTGPAAIAETLRWVASRCSGGVGEEIQFTTLVQSGPLAYSVGFERVTLSVNAQAPRQMVLRVTQVYRLSDGEWRIVHRHADELPRDQRREAA